MAETYDIYWHGPFRLTRGPQFTPEERLKNVIDGSIGKKKGLYLVIGQKRRRRLTRGPLYFGSTMKQSFETRITQHLGKVTNKEGAKIDKLEREGYEVTSIWLGEIRSTMKKTIQELTDAERSMVFFLAPIFNTYLKTAPSAECTIINRINKVYLQKQDIFEWDATRFAGILDIRKCDMSARQPSNENLIAELIRAKKPGGNELKRLFLKIIPGALWKRSYQKRPPFNDNEKPAIF